MQTRSSGVRVPGAGPRHSSSVVREDAIPERVRRTYQPRRPAIPPSTLQQLRAKFGAHKGKNMASTFKEALAKEFSLGINQIQSAWKQFRNEMVGSGSGT